MPEPLKNLFTNESINHFTETLFLYYPKLNKETFIKDILDDTWEQLELAARWNHVTKNLHKHLPQDYETSIEILVNVASNYEGIELFAIPSFIEFYGLDYWVTKQLR
ncbi:MAG: hypothetical protein LBV67_01770 [Streptococcaceae bacterium]|jgi:3-methyladenine DNA glycosylase AlkC|nr:hypothetical protein [Streptococcaceae bacterium]